MKITRVTTAVVEGNFDWTLVRIDSDEGVYGIGESFFAPGLTSIIRALGRLLIGEDPRQVEPLTRKLRLATAPSASGGGAVLHAITGIETALWDLAARDLSVPLYRLFGGAFRNRVRMYADCHAGEALESIDEVLMSRRPSWSRGGVAEDAEAHWDPVERPGVRTPESYARRAQQMADRGFKALKFDIDLPRAPGEDLHARTIPPAQMDRQVELIQAALEAVEGRAEVAFDCHWRYAPHDALRLARRLEGLPVLWLEDPVPPENVAAMAVVAQGTTTPIATGENTYLAQGFTQLIDQRAVDIVAPDLQKAGGLSEARRIAELADRSYLPLAPHNISSPVGTLASAHICAAIPNFIALEWHAAGVPFFDAMLAGGHPIINNGYVELSDAPGLGVELDLEVCRRYARPGEPFFE
ncbi:MAG TPA: mandelate racemase/muconate lactonizing enzyme family protein [Candidatus Dormibacteraeota bacterium]|nr:mandelate racemase/muconate lactonizing enzyme family protein [Candidatus Dormibacteraeota bacterium]